MICPICKSTIEDDAVYCPECGAKQEQTSYCPKCGKELMEGALFCAECGANMGGPIQDQEMQMKGVAPPVRKGHGGRVVAILLLAALLLVAVIGFFVYRYVNKGSEVLSTYTEQSSKKDKTGETKEVKEVKEEKQADSSKDNVTKADIVALGGETCSLEGTIKTDTSGKKVIAWDDGVSISGLDENGQAVLAKDVSNVYINDIGLEEGVLDTVASNKKVILGGQIYFIGDSIYIKANKITDESGSVIENNKDINSQVVKEVISYDYIIPYSSTVLLGDGDVSGLSLQEINYAKNEIYARHGRMFQSAELQNYFDSKSWYRGTIEADAFTDAMLSEIEKMNVTYLSDVEFGINPAGYQLDVR